MQDLLRQLNSRRSGGWRRTSACLLLLILCAALLGGCGGKKEEAATEGGVLKVIFLNGGDRFTSEEEGLPAGIEADIAERTAEILGMELQPTMVTNPEVILTGIAEGSYDLAFGRFPDTDSSLSTLTMSRSYGRGGLFFVTPKYDYTDSLSMRGGGVIGVMGEVKDAAQDIANYSTFVAEDYNNLEQLGADIESGKIILGICNERQAMELISGSLQAQEVVGGPKEAYVALMPADTKIKGSVDAAVAAYLEALIQG